MALGELLPCAFVVVPHGPPILAPLESGVFVDWCSRLLTVVYSVNKLFTDCLFHIS